MQKVYLVLFITITFAIQIITTEGAQFSSKYQASKNYRLSWIIDTVAQTIEFQLMTNTTGWIGLGISSHGQMTNSDIYMCYNQSNKANCTDRYAVAMALPKLDIQQGGSNDIKNITRVYSNGSTIYKFTRLLNTGDSKDIQISQGQQSIILFSLGQMSKANYLQHNWVMTQTLTLWPNGNSNQIQNTDYLKYPGVKIMNLTVNQKISTNKTTYICKYFNVSKMAHEQTSKPYGTKYHAIAYNTIISSHLIHHMVLHICDSDVIWSNQSFSCFSVPDSCKDYVTVWAMGQGVQVLPSQAGFPWGNNVAVVQIHYNNLNQTKNLNLRTTVQVYYSSILRQYDVGVLRMVVPSSAKYINIPPNDSNYSVSTNCSSQCTQRAAGRINVFSNFFHGHQKLSRVFNNITYANGTKDSTSMVNNHFDFNNQYTIQFTNPLQFEPGYSLQLTCFYNNSGNNNSVIGGVSSKQEMCTQMMQFYPRFNGTESCSGSLCIKYS